MSTICTIFKLSHKGGRFLSLGTPHPRRSICGPVAAERGGGGGLQYEINVPPPLLGSVGHSASCSPRQHSLPSLCHDWGLGSGKGSCFVTQ